MTATEVALRLDDVGASSKRYEVYSTLPRWLGRWGGWGNWLFLKYLPGLRGWGPYRELGPREWNAILDLLARSGAVLTVAITATWVDRDGRLIPFPEKFPNAAAVLHEGVRNGLLEVANHGLTHCVLAGGAFRPRAFGSNRRFHREFWEWIPPDEQERHIAESQRILEDYFGRRVVTFVPPGNVFARTTLEVAYRHGLRVLSCQGAANACGPLYAVAEERVVAFHDRDIALHGLGWLKQRIEAMPGCRFVHVRDLAAGEPQRNGGEAGRCSTG